MSDVRDYVGRRSDMLAFRNVLPFSPGREQLLAQELARPGVPGELVTGVQKLAQKLLIILLNKLGTRRYAPTEGTAFMVEAAKGLWRTPADVETSFYTARLDVSRQAQASEAVDDPLDERWGSFDLLGVVLSGDQVSLRLRVLSAAGTSYTYITPIAVPIKR